MSDRNREPRRVHFGARVREIRERLGYKRPDDLALAAGISRRMVISVELGDHAGPKTLRAIGRTLGWREQDVLDYVNAALAELPEPDAPEAAPTDDLAPLDEVLGASLDDLKKIAKLYAHFEARRERRAYKEADERKFVLWALRKQEEHERGIKPPAETNRDVS